MRKITISAVIIIGLSVLLNSCSNASEVKTVFTEEETLRDVIRGKEAGMSWTKELEPEKLTQDIYSDEEHIVYGLQISPAVANVAYNNEQAVYPSLSGFCSLDTTLLPANIKKVVNDFCGAISKDIYNGGRSFFDSHYVFNYVFFRNDLIAGWEKVFESKFPKNRTNLFSKWILGKPFIATEVLLQPVRFYRDDKYIDFTIHIKLSNNKIYQISEGVYGADDE